MSTEDFMADSEGMPQSDHADSTHISGAPPRQPVDAPQRQRCLDPEHSFSVRAPAGSGKTELLTQRVLVLLSRVERPEEILCITFTRKAAGEMLERILDTLRWAATHPRPDSGHKRATWQLARNALARDSEQHWQLLDHPSRLQIQTIDGFCARLTKSLPTLCRFGAQPAILQDAYPVYQQAVQRLLVELEDDSAVAEALERLLEHLDNRLQKVEELLIALLAKRDQWLGIMGIGGDINQARHWLQSALKRLVGEEIDSLRQQLGYEASTLVELADYAAANLPETQRHKSHIGYCLGLRELPGNSAADLPVWRGLCELLLTNTDQWRKRLDKNAGFPAGTDKDSKAEAKARKEAMSALIGQLQDTPELLEQLARIRTLPEDQYNESQWQLLEALTLVLPNLVAHLLLSFAEHNAVDYPQITQAALQALGADDAPTDLALTLDYRIQHILVDEFQDTATPQIELLTRLTRGWQPGDGRTLFIVGDGMQSCYGFRDANVGLFLDARQHGIGDVRMEAIDLSVNFRSQAAIVNWVNDTFAGAYPAQDDIGRGAVSYADSDAFNPALPATEADISIDVFSGYPGRDAEASCVAERVEQALARDPDGSVAILVRSRPHLRGILPALRRAGLRWQANDLDPLSSRMWVIDVVSILRLLLNPADRIAWLALLRSPLCGLDNADLLAIAGKEAISTPVLSRLQQLSDLHAEVTQENTLQETDLSANGYQIIKRLLVALEPAWKNRQRKGIRTEVEGLWHMLGGPHTLANSAQYDDILRVFELIEAQQQGGWLYDLEAFHRGLDNLYASPDAQADERLQVMTMHKSKGLEFDTVILAGLDRPPRREDNPLLLWQQRVNADGEQDLLLSPLSATGEDKDPLYQYLLDEQALKNQMESTRLFYVGATRAVKSLHLVAQLKIDKKLKADDKNGGVQAPNKKSMLAAIWPFVEDQAQLHINPVEEDSEAISSAPTLKQILRLPVNYPLSMPVNEHLLPLAPRQHLTEDDPNIPEVKWQDASRHTGTLAHRILRQWVLHPEHFQSAEQLRTYQPRWQQQLQQLGLNQQQATTGVAQLYTLLSGMLDCPTARWVLDPSHQDSACELEVSYFNGHQARQLVIDRTFVDQGERWIIDYKTSAPAAAQSDAEFIAQEEASYLPQLQAYARVFQAMADLPVRTALYFPATGQLVELSVTETAGS